MAVNLPQPIKMEDQSIKTEIIDLDDYISPEEAVFRLHIKVRNKFKSLYGDESEDTLNNIMKWYIETLNEDSFEIEACQSFIRNMRKHIHFFHGCFKELTWISVDNYLDTMEDILALYLDFECEFFIKHPRKEQILSKNLLQVLRIYLLHQNDRVFNVLLKIKLNLTSDRAKQFLDNIFKMALSPVPINTTDIAFCRAYILHHRWKKVLNPGMYKIIDDLLYKHYSQTPNAVNTNPVLKEVLQPQNDSLLDILAHIMDNDKILCESYFKYVKTQKIQEDLIGDVNNIDIDGRISPSYYNKEDIDGTTEEIETSLFGNVTNVNSRKTHDSLNEDVIKMEESDDDDCVIVGEGTVDCDPDETEIVHEILDDDDDIEAIIYFTAKEPTPKKPPSVQKTTPVPEEISFLNSINVREVKSNKENTNSNVRSQCISISPTSFSSQNLDNDSVKSREILSRKFTRKKVDDLTEDIVIEDADNSTCTVLDVDDNDWDQSKPNDNESEEPSHIFEGLVTPPTSHDDQHGYERDFHNDHMQNSYEEKVNVKEMENSCLTPHSTNCGNLDFCNDSTSVPEKIIHESYVSPTSPDISSTCELNDLIGDEPEMTSEPSEHNIELANTVDDQSTVNSRIMMENCSKENNPFSDIQIGTTYSVNLPDNDFIETVPLADSSKDKQALNDSTEENRSANDPVKESDILSREIEDAQLKHILGDVTSVTEYPEAVNTFRSDSPPVLSLQEKDTDNQFILNQIDSYIQENTTNESVEENVIADGSVLNKSNSPVQKETIEDKHVQIEEVNNSLVKENSVAGDTLDFKTFTNNCVKEKTRINGEHNRSEENERNFLSKQLKVSIPPLDIIKSPEKKMNVIFTSKRNNINKLETEVHLRYNELKGEHGLDDCLNGTLDKINCQSNLDNDFDLFDDNISIGEQEINMPLLNSSNTTTSPSSIVSPEFDKIDDFKNYLTSYQENSKKALKNSPGSHLLEKAPRTNYSETPRPILKSDNNKNLLVPQTKRKRIAFAEEDIIHTPDIQEPIINHTSQVQGILKKSAMSPTLRIPKEHMNMQSLAHFRVKPTDYYLQSNPCVVIERLSEMEIKEWQRVTEKSRRKRLLKQKNSQALSSLAVSNMTMFRVDYDKQSPFITSSVTVRYKAPEEQNWRSNARDPKINPHDEGMVESGENEYFYIPTICKNKCCSNLLEQLNKLNLNSDVKSTIPNVSSNHFCVKIVNTNTEQTNPADTFIDLNLVNKIVENFDKCDEAVNSFDFINQPAAIPEVEEFEKTLQMEEVAKIPTIPSDLDNLNLRKFSPSPIMNCFSPHSPVHTYFSDCTNFNETPNAFQINEDKEENEHQEINVEELEESAKDPIIKIQTMPPETTSIPAPEKLEYTPKEFEFEAGSVPEELVNTRVPDQKEEETFQDPKTACVKPDVFTKETEGEPQTRLPLKKRKHSLANTAEADSDEEAIGPEVIEEILKRARAEENENDISYPATPAISIAEVQERLESQPRTFKTPAEKKEMPPPSVPEYLSVPKIITEQYNTHTYNNPTINYHMNNVPYTFFPCTYFSPILCAPTFDMNVVNAHQPSGVAQMSHPPEHEVRIKREKRSRKRRRE